MIGAGWLALSLHLELLKVEVVLSLVHSGCHLLCNVFLGQEVAPVSIGELVEAAYGGV